MRPVTAPVLIALILLSAAPAEPPSSDPPAAPPAPPRATPAPSIEKVPPEHPAQRRPSPSGAISARAERATRGGVFNRSPGNGRALAGLLGAARSMFAARGDRL